MADAPAKDRQPADKPMTRAEAQRKLGLFAPHDFVTMAFIGLSWVTLIFWKIFGEPTLVNVLCIVALNIVLMQIMTVILLYRVLVFVLDLQADVNLMPETAARIASAYLRYQSGQPTSKGQL